jgi:hypothetical protein
MRHGTVVLWTSDAIKLVINTAVETTILDTGVGGKIIPANHLKVGAMVRLFAAGMHSANYNADPETVELKFKIGALVVSTGAMQMLLGQFSSSFNYSAETIIKSIGASATQNTEVRFMSSKAGSGGIDLIGGGSDSSSTFDSTAAATVDLTVTYTSAGSANLIATHEASLELLNN